MSILHVKERAQNWEVKGLGSPLTQLLTYLFWRHGSSPAISTAHRLTAHLCSILPLEHSIHNPVDVSWLKLLRNLVVGLEGSVSFLGCCTRTGGLTQQTFILSYFSDQASKIKMLGRLRSPQWLWGNILPSSSSILVVDGDAWCSLAYPCTTWTSASIVTWLCPCVYSVGPSFLS